MATHPSTRIHSRVLLLLLVSGGPAGSPRPPWSPMVPYGPPGMRVLHASAKVWHRGGAATFGKVWQSLASKGPACRSSAWAAHAPLQPALQPAQALPQAWGGTVLDRLGPHELLCRPHTLYLGCSILSHSRIGGYGCTRVAGGIKPRSRESRWFPTFHMVPHGPAWSPMVPCGPLWPPVVLLV